MTIHAPAGHPLLVNVARKAALALPDLSEADRANLYEGLALLLPPDEAEKAAETAVAIRRQIELTDEFAAMLKEL